MTLDDETAERIADETYRDIYVNRRRPLFAGPADYVKAGYAARDAEVEELRAELDILRATEDGNLSAMRERAELAEATLAKVQERVERRHCADDPLCGHDDRVWADHFSEVVADVLAILDESPTERETPADEWEYRIINTGQGFESEANDSMKEVESWFEEPDDVIERRRKAGPWEVVPDDRA